MSVWNTVIKRLLWNKLSGIYDERNDIDSDETVDEYSEDEFSPEDDDIPTEED